jgi:hypothetical protein
MGMESPAMLIVAPAPRKPFQPAISKIETLPADEAFSKKKLDEEFSGSQFLPWRLNLRR